MKKIFTFFLFFVLSFSLSAQDHIIQNSGITWVPSDITINVGETVEWQNTGGNHNVNGTQMTFPMNPESFGNAVGPAGWAYQHTFMTAGSYNFHCDPHQTVGMTGTITVVMPPNSTPAMIIAGAADPQPTNGTGGNGAGAKSLELYVTADIADLSEYGIGVANNGGGTDGVEFTFPAVSAVAGDCFIITDTSNLDKFVAFFGFTPDFLVPTGGTSAVGFNGDDAIELYQNGQVIDVFGDINMDGTGTAWDFVDGWVYRIDGSGPDGSTFVQSNWAYSGVDALQSNDFTMNTQYANPFPNCTYSPMASMELVANDDIYNLPMNMTSSLDVLANDMTPNGITSLTITGVSLNSIAVANGTTDITYTPNADFCGIDEVYYQICDANGCQEAVVTITIDCPVDYPAYDIGVVTADADANSISDSLGVDCTLTGVVYGVDMNGGGAVSFTIIGADGHGINVFSSSSSYTVLEGDEVSITGTISQFNGLTQISPEEIILNSGGNALVTATDVTALGEDTESQLVRVVGVTMVDPTQWDGTGGSFNFDVTDGTNTFAVRIDSDVDLANMPAPSGVLNITGLGGQFDNSDPYTEGYQLLPRYAADIEEEMATEITANNDSYNVPMDMAISLDVLANDLMPNGITSLTVLSVSLNSIAVANGTMDITYTPNTDFCGPDEVIYEICDANNCVEATVSIVVECPTAFPTYDIGLVTADADGNGVGDSLGVDCTLTGVVYGVDMRGGDGLAFTIIGSDGEGINVFTFEEISGYSVLEGDEVTITGTINSFNGLTQFGPVEIILNSGGNTLVTATDVTLLGEDTESQLVRLVGVTMVDPTQWDGTGSSFNFDVTDGTNTFAVRIDSDVDLANMPAPSGLLNITGIGGQFDSSDPYTEGYQLFPRYAADIEEVVGTEILANNDAVTLDMDIDSNIDVLANDLTPNGLTTLTITSGPSNGTATVNGTTDILYTPTAGFCGSDQLSYEICDANDCSTATVDITIACPPSFPAYDIGVVTADADGDSFADSLNVTCQLTGIVYGVDLDINEGISFTIIDANGDGINVFNFVDISSYVVVEGDEISVDGEIIQFNGLTEIVPEAIVVNSTFNDLITPTDVTDLGESTESQLIRMSNMTLVDPTQWLGDGSSFNVEITDGTTVFAMRIDDAVDLASSPAPVGVLSITGIGGQFDNSEPYTEGYQILPRYMEDISAIIATTDVNLGDKINVYPNPVNDLLQIRSEIDLDQIRVTNVLGQVVNNIRQPNTSETINMENLQAGVYMVTFISGDQIWTSQVVKH